VVPDDDHRPHWNSTASMSGTDEWRYEMLLVAQIEKLFLKTSQHARFIQAQ
jgi:hypothetical protein